MMARARGSRALCMAVAPCLIGLAWAGSAWAQSSPATAAAPVSINIALPDADGPREALARIFYEPEERHQLDIAEAAALSGEDSKALPIAALRFNGWLTGPGPTHAWVNGKAHIANEQNGTLAPARASGGTQGSRGDGQLAQEPAPAGADFPSRADNVRFDAKTQQLILLNERGAPRHLRAGQSEDKDPLLPLSSAAQNAAKSSQADAEAPLGTPLP